jgi:hypothetical protein
MNKRDIKKLTDCIKILDKNYKRETVNNILLLNSKVPDISFVFKNELDNSQITRVIEHVNRGVPINKQLPYIDNRFCADQMDELFDYLMNHDEIPDILFNPELDDYQMREIKLAIERGYDLSIIARNELSGEQMDKLIECMDLGISINDITVKPNC